MLLLGQMEVVVVVVVVAGVRVLNLDIREDVLNCTSLRGQIE